MPGEHPGGQHHRYQAGGGKTARPAVQHRADEVADEETAQGRLAEPGRARDHEVVVLAEHLVEGLGEPGDATVLLDHRHLVELAIPDLTHGLDRAGDALADVDRGERLQVLTRLLHVRMLFGVQPHQPQQSDHRRRDRGCRSWGGALAGAAAALGAAVLLGLPVQPQPVLHRGRPLPGALRDKVLEEGHHELDGRRAGGHRLAGEPVAQAAVRQPDRRPLDAGLADEDPILRGAGGRVETVELVGEAPGGRRLRLGHRTIRATRPAFRRRIRP
ncbi:MULTISPECIES: hypothetical protein [unclassified Actinoplanes]|uniref:hypothetical protein n=1 Tax=unclassified Actinoplanes TaxID=2626549 RepID=UPI0012BA9AED|nr:MULTISPECIES: hypothetical protein [unclassified Actinoplanes]